MITPLFTLLPVDIDSESVPGDVAVLLSRLPDLVPRQAVERILELVLSAARDLAEANLARQEAEGRADEAGSDASYYARELKESASAVHSLEARATDAERRASDLEYELERRQGELDRLRAVAS